MTSIDIKFTQFRLDFSQINNEKKLKEAVKKANQEIKFLKYVLFPHERPLKKKLWGVQHMKLTAGSKEEYLANYLDAIEMFKMNRNALNQQIAQYNQSTTHHISLLKEVDFKSWKTYDGSKGLFWFVEDTLCKIVSYLDFKDIGTLIKVSKNFASLNNRDKNENYFIMRGINGILFDVESLSNKDYISKLIFKQLYNFFLQAVEQNEFESLLLPKISKMVSGIRPPCLFFFSNLFLLKILKKNVNDPETKTLFDIHCFLNRNDFNHCLISFFDPKVSEIDLFKATNEMTILFQNSMTISSLQYYGF